MISSASLMTVNVFNPRKSIFNKPRSPNGFIEYWVTISFEFVPVVSGTIFVSGSAPITTPAAWVEALREIPSRVYP